MNELVLLLDKLAAMIPGSKQANDLIDSQPPCLKTLIRSNQNSLIKKSISTNKLYADMTQITLY